MTYKVYISTGTSPTQQQALEAVKLALWDIHEFPISAITSDDLGSTQSALFEKATHMIDGCDVFIGLYDASYGPELLPDGRSLAQAEYEYAVQGRGLLSLVYMEQGTRAEDPRQQAFIQHLVEHHVVGYYTNVEDLQALVKLNLATFRRTASTRRRLRPASQNFVESSPRAREALPAEPEEAQEEIQEEIQEAPQEKSRSSAMREEPPVERSASKKSASPSESAAAPPAPSSSAARPAAAPAPAPFPPPAASSMPELEESEAYAALDDIRMDLPMPEPVEPDAALAEIDPLEGLVNRALEFAADDIEQILGRALELHDARHHVLAKDQPSGWLQINPIFGEPLPQSQFQADIFMIMPFRPQYDAIYQNVIRPVTAGLNLTVKRGDDFSSASGSIIQEVWAAINACRLVIAETTEVNANVYYELGIAHTLGKPAILLTQLANVEELPFDIRHLRFIVYENTISGGEKLEKDLQRSIVWLLNDLEER